MFLFAKLVMEHLERINRLCRLQEEMQWLERGERRNGVVEKLNAA